LSPRFRYEQRDSHEFLSHLVDFLHDELTASPTPPEAAAVAATIGSTMESSLQDEGKASSPKENANPNEAEEDTVDNRNCTSTTIVHNDSGALLPRDEYFQLNVWVCLECDSCGYSR
jgi:hypothetical protein